MNIVNINSSLKKCVFFLIQTLKFCILKILTFHFKKIKTGVLLIRIDNLGDFLISLPVFEQIAEYVHAENKTVTIVVSESLFPFCKNFTFLDNIISLPHNSLKSLKTRIKSYRIITKYAPDKTILFHVLGRSGEYDYMALLPQSHERYAMETMNVWPVPQTVCSFRKRFFNRKYTQTVEYDITKTLACNEVQLAQCAMKKTIHEKLGNIKPLFPLPNFTILNFPYYLVVPGASSEEHKWPSQNFAALIDLLTLQLPHLTPVLIGSNADMATAEKLVEQSCNKSKIVNLCGKTSLLELFNIIQKAEFLITNDTGPYHMAPLVNTKTFCIAGRWHLGAHGPNPLYTKSIFIFEEGKCLRCLENCYSQDTPRPCLQQVQVSKVFEIIKRNYNQ